MKPRIGTAVVILMLAASAVSFSAQAPPPAKPGPEMQRLQALVGNWTFTEEYEKTPMTPQGGEGKGSFRTRLGPGGFSIVSDFEGVWPVGKFEGLQIITWDAKENAYKSYTLGNDFPGVMVATGHWEGNALVFTGEVEFAGSKMYNRSEMRDIGPKAMTYFSYFGPQSPPPLFATGKATKP